MCRYQRLEEILDVVIRHRQVWLGFKQLARVERVVDEAADPGLIEIVDIVGPGLGRRVLAHLGENLIQRNHFPIDGDSGDLFEKRRLQIDDRSARRCLLGDDLDRCAGELTSHVLQKGVDLLRLLVGGHLLPCGCSERPGSMHGARAERDTGGRERLHHGATRDAPAPVIGNRAADRHLVAEIECLFHLRVLLCRPGNVEQARCVDRRNTLSTERSDRRAKPTPAVIRSHHDPA